jgi:hypothetical protein
VIFVEFRSPSTGAAEALGSGTAAGIAKFSGHNQRASSGCVGS